MVAIMPSPDHDDRHAGAEAQLVWVAELALYLSAEAVDDPPSGGAEAIGVAPATVRARARRRERAPRAAIVRLQVERPSPRRDRRAQQPAAEEDAPAVHRLATADRQ